MKVNAYVLAADPWWLENSIRSYYALVDRIVVSYDSDGLSWTGTVLPVEDCLSRIRSLDTAGKCEFIPGHFARSGHHPLDNDTFQRQCALREASEGADWVIQLDTDEVLMDPDEFSRSLCEAERRAASAMEYPSRWIYNRVGARRFLERSTRWWRVSASYPGPVAIRAGSTLRHCRQSDAPLYRVDFRPHSTDMAHPRDALVHRVVPVSSGILHYSWVRDDEFMRRKAGWSGHSDTYSDPEALRQWRFRGRHPLRAAACSPLRGRGDGLRIFTLPPEYSSWPPSP